MKALATIITAVSLTGCAAMPDSVLFEGGHTSHASAGVPFGPANEEAGFTNLGAMLRWRGENGAYLDIGEMWNVQGRNGGGFKGPAEIFQMRFGVEVAIGE